MTRAMTYAMTIAAFVLGAACADRDVAIVEPDPAQRLPTTAAPPTPAPAPGVLVAPVARPVAPPTPSVANVDAPAVPSPSVADAPRRAPNRARRERPCGGPRRRLAPGERAPVYMCGEHEGPTGVPDIFR